MPSVAKSAEQTTSNKMSAGDVSVDAQSKIQQFVDKRIRNLEKRKLKLIQLKEDMDKGVRIDDEQKTAVQKFDTVVELITFLKEFHKHLTDTFTEHNKLQKTIEKKEKLERKQQELDRLKTIIVYQDILGRFDTTVRSDFRNGLNGAIKLTDDELSRLDEFYNLTTLNTNGGEPTADQSAERWIALAEGRNREAFAGVTFKDLKELLQKISECSYFQHNNSNAVTTLETNTTVTNSVTVTKAENVNPQLFAKESDDSNALKNTPSLIFQSNAPEIMKLTNQFASGISFMRDSTLESELQHKDPAVVAVSNSGFPYQYNMQTNDGIVVGQLNSIANSNPLNSSQKVNAYESVNQLSSIPTQTFTNQNFTTLIPSTIVPVTLGTAIAVQQIVPQDLSPHAVTSSEMITGQQIQNFNHQYIDSMHDSKPHNTSHHEVSAVFQNSDDSGGYRNNSKTRTRAPRPHQGSQANNMNGYNARQRNGSKGFQANSYNGYQNTNGTSYGNNNYDRNANNVNRSGHRMNSRGGGRTERGGQNATQFKA